MARWCATCSLIALLSLHPRGSPILASVCPFGLQPQTVANGHGPLQITRLRYIAPGLALFAGPRQSPSGHNDLREVP
jgi:hypothetical protein